MRNETPLLDVCHLSVTFRQYEKGFNQIELPVIRDLNLRIHKGELVAVIGASGSGKSLLAHAILGILPYNASMGGKIAFKGEVMSTKRLAQLRGREIALVPQSTAFLDPLMKIGSQIQKGRRDKTSRQKTADILAKFGLADRTKDMYPFELSGGMTRRILISTATVDNPDLVIADEPTPGLHTSLARRVLSHFTEMTAEGKGVLLITHDLELAMEVADRIVVFYAGTTVEEAPAADFKQEQTLRHPYTRALWRAMPQNGFHSVPGGQPYVLDMPDGCPYAPRCERCTAECGGEVSYIEMNGGYVRCLHAGGDGV